MSANMSKTKVLRAGECRWTALQAEMRIDMQRIWKRNLGRDDRCMADLGKEVTKKNAF